MTILEGPIQARRGTAAQWTAANPTLLSGEMGFETDTGLWKVGDGATAWNSLSYMPFGVERRFHGADQFIAFGGSPSLGTTDTNRRVAHWLLDPTNGESLAATVPPPPPHWRTFDLFVILGEPAAAASGNVVMTVGYQSYASGDSMSAGTNIGVGVNVVCAAAAVQYRVTRHTIATAQSNTFASNALAKIVAIRDASHGSDNYANDIGFIGVEIVRAS